MSAISHFRVGPFPLVSSVAIKDDTMESFNDTFNLLNNVNFHESCHRLCVITYKLHFSES